MKRTMVFLAAVIASALFAGAPAGYAQQQPVSAAGDTLKTTGDEVPPASSSGGPMSMQVDSTATTVHHRVTNRLMYYASLGVGSAYNYLPQSFRDSYSPSFGIAVAGGVAKNNVRIGVSASFNFFFSNGPTTLYPNDLNILTIFAELKYIPLGGTARPYLLACGGYYRQWIVNENYLENVLGYGGGAGVELAIDKTRHLFVEGRYIQGQTRQTEKKANTELIPFRLGLTWVF
jgi:hypothetical protein